MEVSEGPAGPNMVDESDLTPKPEHMGQKAAKMHADKSLIYFDVCYLI